MSRFSFIIVSSAREISSTRLIQQFKMEQAKCNLRVTSWMDGGSAMEVDESLTLERLIIIVKYVRVEMSKASEAHTSHLPPHAK